jgi:hypothetical protein
MLTAECLESIQRCPDLLTPTLCREVLLVVVVERRAADGKGAHHDAADEHGD